MYSHKKTLLTTLKLENNNAFMICLHSLYYFICIYACTFGSFRLVNRIRLYMYEAVCVATQ